MREKCGSWLLLYYSGLCSGFKRSFLQFRILDQWMRCVIKNRHAATFLSARDQCKAMPDLTCLFNITLRICMTKLLSTKLLQRFNFPTLWFDNLFSPKIMVQFRPKVFPRCKFTALNWTFEDSNCADWFGF